MLIWFLIYLIIYLHALIWLGGYWSSVGLAYHRYWVRLPARSLSCKNLGQVSHTHVQCSPI